MARRREVQEGSTALGLRIKHARTAKGLTQEALAAKASCTKGAVSQWEKGDVVNLRIERLFQVADALGVEARWLAIGEGPQARQKPSDTFQPRMEEGEALKRLRAAAPGWRPYVLSLAMMSPTQQRLLLDSMREAVPDAKVEQAFGSRPDRKK